MKPCLYRWFRSLRAGRFHSKMEKLAHSLGIENLSRSQVSEMTKGLNEQVEEFRNRSLAGTVYPFGWVDALYEKDAASIKPTASYK